MTGKAPWEPGAGFSRSRSQNEEELANLDPGERHILLDRRGHWWNWEDDEPPEWYRERRIGHEAIRSPAERSTRREAGRIPPEIEWSDLAAYRCRHCSDDCINELASVYYETKQCRSCYDVPALEDDHPVSADRPTGVSPGEASRVLGASGANASASGSPAGSDPLRVDPAAGAHPPSEARGLLNGGGD